jgi:hypothetical protein
MMKKIILAPFIYAIKVDSLYQAEVMVVSQTGDIKEQAVKEGLLQVLIKISGDPYIDQRHAIKKSLKKAEYYVSDYQFLPTTKDSSKYVLRIAYEPNDVNRLLKQAKIVYWGEERPLVFVWLVVTNAQHTTDIISNEAPGDVYANVLHEANKYGLPFIFPMLDVNEVNQISFDDTTHIAKLMPTIAKRYSPEAILIGDITENENDVQSKWELVMGDHHWNWVIHENTTNAVISSVVKQVQQAVMAKVKPVSYA